MLSLAPTFSMNDAHSSRGQIPFAGPAAMKPPADTPTWLWQSEKSMPVSVSSKAQSAPIS